MFITILYVKAAFLKRRFFNQHPYIVTQILPDLRKLLP